jgi:hypothetical protein
MEANTVCGADHLAIADTSAELRPKTEAQIERDEVVQYQFDAAIRRVLFAEGDNPLVRARDKERRAARFWRCWAWIWFGCCWIVVAVWAGSWLLKAVRP